MCKVWIDHHLAIRFCMMIVSPKCPLSFFTIVYLWKKIKIIRNVNIVLLILLMSILFTFRLGVAAFLVTSLVAIVRICFIVWEQSSQIRDLQRTLHSLCWKALADKIESSDYYFWVNSSSVIKSSCLFTKGAIARGHFCLGWRTISPDLQANFLGSPRITFGPNSLLKGIPY